MEAAFAAITAIISIVVYSHSVFFFYLGGRREIVNIRKLYKHATACSRTLDSCVESIQVLSTRVRTTDPSHTIVSHAFGNICET